MRDIAALRHVRSHAIWICALALAWTMLAAMPAQAATAVSGAFSENEGYGRIVLTWPGGVPPHAEAVTSGVLVVKFDKPFTTDLSEFMRQMPNYVAMARQDTDGRTLRLALKFDYWLNVQQAENSLYLDLLPNSWTGKAPPLPPEVSARLAAAAEARKKAAEEARLVKERGIVDPGAPNPDLRVRVATHEGMTRLVFDWNQPVLYSLVQQEGSATITFDRTAKVALAPIRVAPPPYLETIGAVERNGRLSVFLKLKPGVSVTDFREELGIVLDLKPGQDTRAPATEAQAAEAQKEVATAKPIAAADTHTREAMAPTSRDASPAPQTHAPKSIMPMAAAAASETPKVPAPPTTVVEAPSTASPEPAANPVMPAETVEQSAALKVTASTREGRTDIVFPWTRPVGAAVFVRADTLWVVFDERAPIDLSPIGADVAKRIGAPLPVDIENGLALAFPLQERRALVSTVEEGTAWRVSLGDALTDTGRPIEVKRAWRDTGEGVVSFDLKSARRIVQIHDPVVRDVLYVATARAPIQSMQTPRSFVEFQALQTAHGLAIVRMADDLNVAAGPDAVVVTRRNGLTLSADNANAATSATPAGYPAYMDFTTWRGKGSFIEQKQALERKIALSSIEETGAARIAYARFLLANGLGPEALVQLDGASAVDRKLGLDPFFCALRGVAKVLAHRNAEALSDLSINPLAMDPNAAIWRGLARVELGRMDEARRDFDLAALSIDTLDPDLAVKVHLKAARADLAANDLPAARAHLRQVPLDIRDAGLAAETLLMQAEITEALDRPDEAATLYDKAAAANIRPIMVEARFRKALMLNRKGTLGEKELTAELDKLRMMWRGDETERRILSALAERQLADGDVVSALKIMRIATVNFPDSDEARAMGARMPDIFAGYFISDRAAKLPPVQAVSLYYSFQDLTPIGQKGDELIRRLAEHLVSADLLSQAETLLRYQIEQRLYGGVGKAQVAARLASIYLLDQKPEEALRIIRATAQNALPADLDRQRRLIEARTLASLKQYDLALDLLSEITGPIADVLRADVLWEAQRWDETGAAVETLLVEAAAGTSPLSGDQRFDIMRGAIAYSLADDEEGLTRLRSKFGNRMAETPDASAFAIVTDPIEKQGVAFRELASHIASVNTMERFVNSLKKTEKVSAVDGIPVASN